MNGMLYSENAMFINMRVTLSSTEQFWHLFENYLRLRVITMQARMLLSLYPRIGVGVL